MRDIYQDYVEKWQEMAREKGQPVLTASQNNLNGLLMCPVIDDNRDEMHIKDWIKKYKDYDDQVLRKFLPVADTGGDCCKEPEDEDEIDFFHEDADEEDQTGMPVFAGASPKTGGASLNPGGAPSPKHYRKIKFTDDDGAQSPSEDPKDHECEAGMTELDGWIICKHCGANLKKL